MMEEGGKSGKERGRQRQGERERVASKSTLHLTNFNYLIDVQSAT